jgi:hypothetical protein
MILLVDEPTLDTAEAAARQDRLATAHLAQR